MSVHSIHYNHMPVRKFCARYNKTKRIDSSWATNSVYSKKTTSAIMSILQQNLNVVNNFCGVNDKLWIHFESASAAFLSMQPADEDLNPYADSPFSHSAQAQALLSASQSALLIWSICDRDWMNIRSARPVDVGPVVLRSDRVVHAQRIGRGRRVPARTTSCQNERWTC